MKKLLIGATLSIAVAAVIKRVAGNKKTTPGIEILASSNESSVRLVDSKGEEHFKNVVNTSGEAIGF